MSYLPIGKDTGDHDVQGNPDMELREQDRWLPIANVARLMKNTLPASAKVSKDAKECMQECVSEFISFITSEASDKCLREKRKTINGEDVLYSMHDLGFENYAEVLKIYLAKYREQQALKQERGESRTSKKLAKKLQRADAKSAPEADEPYMKEELDSQEPELPQPAQDYFHQYEETGERGDFGAGQDENMHMGDVHVASLDENMPAMGGKDEYQYEYMEHGELKDKRHDMENINNIDNGIDDLGKLGEEGDMDTLAAGTTYY